MKNSIGIICAIFLGLVTFSQVYADEFSVKEAAEEFNSRGLSQPIPEKDGRLQTLNKKGAVAPEFDEATSKFIEFAKGKKVLEIGGAYGKVMSATLKKYPSTIYHMIDLDERHLFIAADNLEKSNIDKKVLDKAKLISGDITERLSITDKYDAILVARVLHFLTPDQLNDALTNLSGLLNKGGRVYVIAITPYVKRYESFIPEYERRVSIGDEYPGYVLSLRDWVNKEVTTPEQIASISEEPFMFLDDKVLSRIFKKHNFKIIEAKLAKLSYKSTSWALDGRENVIFIAGKL